ncbi:MAG TPA: hypothetical protein DGJ56_01485 [Verrucomicrobiales bacterium]|nr:hypothetical protein [Verrucomicrobiales bacterium]
MDTKGELLKLLDQLRALTGKETQAIGGKDFDCVDAVQEEKAAVRSAILRLEAPAMEGRSRFADDPEVQQAVDRIMEMDRSNSAHLSREMASLKQEAEYQTLTGKTLRRVHGAYAQRQAVANWQVVT